MPSSARVLGTVDDLHLRHVRPDEQAREPADDSTKRGDLAVLCRRASAEPSDTATDRHFYRAIRNLRDLGFRERVADFLYGPQQLVQRVLVRSTVLLEPNVHDARDGRMRSELLDHGVLGQAPSQRLSR